MVNRSSAINRNSTLYNVIEKHLVDAAQVLGDDAVLKICNDHCDEIRWEQMTTSPYILGSYGMIWHFLFERASLIPGLLGNLSAWTMFSINTPIAPLNIEDFALLHCLEACMAGNVQTTKYSLLYCIVLNYLSNKLLGLTESNNAAYELWSLLRNCTAFAQYSLLEYATNVAFPALYADRASTGLFIWTLDDCVTWADMFGSLCVCMSLDLAEYAARLHISSVDYAEAIALREFINYFQSYYFMYLNLCLAIEELWIEWFVDLPLLANAIEVDGDVDGYNSICFFVWCSYCEYVWNATVWWLFLHERCNVNDAESFCSTAFLHYVTSSARTLFSRNTKSIDTDSSQIE